MSDPHPVDMHVGQRVRLARISVGLSQEKLGDAVGITFQQIQKYEKGTNRISASRLFQFSEVLGVDIPFFFKGVEHAGGRNGLAPALGAEFDRVDVELLRSLAAIQDPAVKRKLLALVNTLSLTSRTGTDTLDGGQTKGA
jgi:transcriptional regulator with XRE-family HTH domain